MLGRLASKKCEGGDPRRVGTLSSCGGSCGWREPLPLVSRSGLAETEATIAKPKKASAKPTMSEAEVIKRLKKDIDAYMEDSTGDRKLRRRANEVLAEANRHARANDEKNRKLGKKPGR
jgi:hypothetical protein